MSHYIPVTNAEKEEMLREMGLTSIDDLFADIPKELMKIKVKIPDALSEMELVDRMKCLARKNADTANMPCFLGAGAYDHFIPAAVGRLTSREEFYTSYTPYQPEISQGTLQAIFEFQSMICMLTGMDAANASLYDGATALAEGAMLACRATGRNEVVLSGALNPRYKKVLETYLKFSDISIKTVGHGSGCRGGRSCVTEVCEISEAVTDATAAVIIQSPNFFGVIENLKEAAGIAHAKGALLVVSADPLSLAVLKPPGDLGADVATGEGQPLGIPLSFGGPYLGYFAVKSPLIRKMPGRIAGETKDLTGKRGYVLTLQTREQHIRRGKANSNICTNQALCALSAVIYMSLMGKNGLREVANTCIAKSKYAYDSLISAGIAEPLTDRPFFREFPVKLLCSPRMLNEYLRGKNIIGGCCLENDFPELENGLLIAVTEKRSKAEIDHFIKNAVEFCKMNTAAKLREDMT